MQNWKVEGRLKVAHFETVIPHVLVVVSWTSGRAGGWFWFDDGLYHHEYIIWHEDIDGSEVIEATKLVLKIAAGINGHVTDSSVTANYGPFKKQVVASLCAFDEVLDVAIVDILLVVVSHG